MIITLSLFFAMGCSTMFFDNWSANFDMISALPLEVATIILRKLDGKSLLNAVQVSRKWLRIIKSDRVLRRTVREELARQRQERLKRHFGCIVTGSTTLTITPGETKKRRRVFEKSIKTTERKSKKPCMSSTTRLVKLR